MAKSICLQYGRQRSWIQWNLNDAVFGVEVNEHLSHGSCKSACK